MTNNNEEEPELTEAQKARREKFKNIVVPNPASDILKEINNGPLAKVNKVIQGLTDSPVFADMKKFADSNAKAYEMPKMEYHNPNAYVEELLAQILEELKKLNEK